MQLSNPTDEDLDHRPLTFGKYGPARVGGPLTPDQVSECDPKWLVWAYETVKDKPVCSKILYDACLEDDSIYDPTNNPLADYN